MKQIPLLVCFVLLGVSGCGKPQATVYSADGGKVTTDGQGNVSVVDEKGTKVDMKSGEEGWSAKSSDGSQISVDKGGMRGTNERGETFEMGAGEVSETELSVPFYPGSKAVSGRDMKADTNGKKTFVSVRTTSDTSDKVINFYRDKVKEATTTQAGDMSAIGGKLADGRQVSVMAIKKGGVVEIQVAVSSE